MECYTQQLELTTVYESRSESRTDVGLQRGLQKPSRAAEFTCEHCRRPFHPGRKHATPNNPLRFCSRVCKDDHERGQIRGSPHTFIPTDVEKQVRIRANGLVNMRIRRGAMVRPKCCQWCRIKKRLDAHHPDYSRPDLVAFLCRRCHMRCHHHTGFEQQVLAKIKTVVVPVCAPSPSLPARLGAK